MISILLLLVAASSFIGPDTTGNPATWVTPDDYPPGALQRDEQGRTGFVVKIGLDGKPTSCQIVIKSGYDDLDRRTCELMVARSRFEPAIDTNGQPIHSTYRSFATWSMERPTHAPAKDMADIVLSVGALPNSLGKRPLVHAYIRVGADGAATDCYVKPGKAVRGLETIACQQALAQWHFTALTDEAGAKVPSVQSVLVAFEVTSPK